MIRTSTFAIAALALSTAMAYAASSPATDAVRASVMKLVPNAKIDAIEPAPMEGFQQVLMGGQLVYVSNDGRYLLQGGLYDASTKVDLTDQRLGKARLSKLSSVPTSQHLVFAPASKPKYKVTVFTDIDCGYCRKLHSEMADYNAKGIEVDYLFFPRSGLNTPSYDKAVSVWCAKDRNAAFTAAKAGSDPAPLKCDNPIAEQFQLGVELGV
ncbi:MAG: disulfide isomerase DsbC N-terminal domain-containing protein, partial [Dokdonella sp.]